MAVRVQRTAKCVATAVAFKQLKFVAERRSFDEALQRRRAGAVAAEGGNSASPGRAARRRAATLPGAAAALASSASLASSTATSFTSSSQQSATPVQPKTAKHATPKLRANLASSKLILTVPITVSIDFESNNGDSDDDNDDENGYGYNNDDNDNRGKGARYKDLNLLVQDEELLVQIKRSLNKSTSPLDEFKKPSDGLRLVGVNN